MPLIYINRGYYYRYPTLYRNQGVIKFIAELFGSYDTICIHGYFLTWKYRLPSANVLFDGCGSSPWLPNWPLPFVGLLNLFLVNHSSTMVKVSR